MIKRLLVLTIILTGCQAGYDGAAGNNGRTGAQGIQGVAGQDGAAGQNGLSCSVTSTEAGALITCPDSSSALVSPPPAPTFTFICHRPPGTPTRGIDLYAPDTALEAHLAHGDNVGECAE